MSCICICCVQHHLLNHSFSAGGIVAPITYYPQGAGSIWLDNVQCLGTESRLFDCPNVGIGIHDCTHIEDVGVMCGKPQYRGWGGSCDVIFCMRMPLK